MVSEVSVPFACIQLVVLRKISLTTKRQRQGKEEREREGKRETEREEKEKTPEGSNFKISSNLWRLGSILGNSFNS